MVITPAGQPFRAAPYKSSQAPPSAPRFGGVVGKVLVYTPAVIFTRKMEVWLAWFAINIAIKKKRADLATNPKADDLKNGELAMLESKFMARNHLVRAWALWQAAQMDDLHATPLIVRGLRDRHTEVADTARAAVCFVLKDCKDAEIRKHLEALLDLGHDPGQQGRAFKKREFSQAYMDHELDLLAYIESKTSESKTEETP